MSNDLIKNSAKMPECSAVKAPTYKIFKATSNETIKGSPKLPGWNLSESPTYKIFKSTVNEIIVENNIMMCSSDDSSDDSLGSPISSKKEIYKLKQIVGEMGDKIKSLEDNINDMYDSIYGNKVKKINALKNLSNSLKDDSSTRTVLNNCSNVNIHI